MGGRVLLSNKAKKTPNRKVFVVKVGKGELDLFLVKRWQVGEYREVNFRNTIIANFKMWEVWLVVNFKIWLVAFYSIFLVSHNYCLISQNTKMFSFFSFFQQQFSQVGSSILFFFSLTLKLLGRIFSNHRCFRSFHIWVK